MRLFLSFVLFFSFKLLFAQQVTYPTIDVKEATLQNAIPHGWLILDSATGDLNHDHLKDAVIILQHKDSVRILNADKDTVLTQPRILLILFKNVSGNGYSVALQNNTFILNHDNANMEDPY